MTARDRGNEVGHAGQVLALLLGSAALLVLAGFLAWPMLLTRHRPDLETQAIRELLSIRNAQGIYRERDKDGNGTRDFAASLSALVDTGPAGDEDLIDRVLASGVKQGYRFTIYECEHPRFVWFVRADPTQPGMGDHLGANMTGLIFCSTTGPVRFDPKDGSSPDPILGE